MRIFISGVACVGKTTVGKKVAVELGYNFFDLDEEVEKYYGRAISYLQKESIGLEKFRAKVAVVLQEIVNANHDNYVVALPPSGFRQPYWKIIQSVNSITIVLTDGAVNILNRIIFFDDDSNIMEKDLTNHEKEHYLREIRLDMEYYGRFYRKAMFRVNLEGANVEKVAEKIQGMLRETQ